MLKQKQKSHSSKSSHTKQRRKLSSKNTLNHSLAEPTIAKHIPPPLKVKETTTFKPNDINTGSHTTKDLYDNNMEYNFLNNSDIYEQLKVDKHHQQDRKKVRKLIDTIDDNDVDDIKKRDLSHFHGDNSHDHNQYHNPDEQMMMEKLSQNIVNKPNHMYQTLIDVLLPPNTILDEYSYLRIKKMSQLNPDLLDMNKNKLSQRLTQLSKIVLNPSFYKQYYSRHVYKKHDISEKVPQNSIISYDLSSYLDQKKENLLLKINDNNDVLEKEFKDYKTLHQYPYHPMVIHVFERFPLILRRKHIENTPEMIKEIFNSLNYSSQIEQGDENDGLDVNYDENFNKIINPDDIEVNPYELLGKYPTLLSLDLTNKINEKIDQFTSHLLNFLTTQKNHQKNNNSQKNENTTEDTYKDSRYTRQQIQKCNNYTLQIILAQPDILNANISSLIPKRLNFIHQSALLSDPVETIEKIIIPNPRLLSPGLKPSQLQRLSLLRLKPPRFDHIAMSDIKALGFEADFALDMIKRLQSKLPHDFPKFEVNSHNNGKSGKKQQLSIEEMNKNEEIYDSYNQCWAQLLGTTEEKNELIKLLILMHNKTFNLLFSDFSSARKQANQTKHGVKLQKKYQGTDFNPTIAHDRLLNLSAAPINNDDDNISDPDDHIEPFRTYDDALIEEIEELDAVGMNKKVMEEYTKSNEYDNVDISHFVKPFNTTPDTLNYEHDKVGLVHPQTPSRETVPNQYTKKVENIVSHDSKHATTLTSKDHDSFNRSELKLNQRDEARQREMKYKGKSHIVTSTGNPAVVEDLNDDDGDVFEPIVSADPSRIEFGMKLTRKQHQTLLNYMANEGNHHHIDTHNNYNENLEQTPEQQEYLLKYIHKQKLQKLEKQKLQKQALTEESYIKDEVEFYENTNPKNEYIDVDIANAALEVAGSNESIIINKNIKEKIQFYDNIDIDNMFDDDNDGEYTSNGDPDADSSSQTTVDPGSLSLNKEDMDKQAAEQQRIDVLKEKKIKKLSKMYKQQSSQFETQWRGDSKYDRPNM